LFIIFLVLINREKKNKDEILEILHQSANFIVINKKPDILINSNDKSKKTVQSILKKQFPELAEDRLVHDFYFTHRLDFATSGILCIPTNKKACSEIQEVFEQQKSSKYYLALVRGWLENEFEKIDIPIGEDIRFSCTSKKMCSPENENEKFCKNPRRSVTKLLVLEKGYYNNKPVTKLLLKPITGRRHQLRVHLSELGFCIVGDYTYSQRSDISPPRMFLHAFRLVLPNSIENLDILTTDPFTEKRLKYKWKKCIVYNELPHAFDLIDAV
jgi:23S rRNA-/tRNA-specific pseudouridylate synthase